MILLGFVAIINLYLLGLHVTTPDGVARKMRCILLLSAVDLPARALLLQMKQFNGKHGCCYCYQEGGVLPGNPLHRFWPPQATLSSSIRTHESVIENAMEATFTDTPVVICAHICMFLLI